MRRDRWMLLVLLASGGCLREADGFVEPAPVYGDCSFSDDACQEDLICAEVVDQSEGPSGYNCVPLDCDDDVDCPSPETGTAKPQCFPNGGRCMISCTPRRCESPDGCPPCPTGASCAATCGPRPPPEPSFGCIACPEDMECFPAGGSPSDPFWACGHR